MRDAIAHHVWATLRLIDACLPLSEEQLATAVPGTYGSMIDTIRHLVAGDSGYLFVIGGGQTQPIEEEGKGLAELRAVMEANGAAWSTVLDGELDPEAILVRHRDDGSEFHAPRGVRLAQVLHHGTDHRSQICTALTTLGLEPPEIAVWDFAWEQGRVQEVPPAS